MPLIVAAAISHCRITGVHVITQKGVHDIDSGKRASARIHLQLSAPAPSPSVVPSALFLNLPAQARSGAPLISQYPTQQ